MAVGCVIGKGGAVRMDYRPVHEYTLTDGVEYIRPKKRAYLGMFSRSSRLGVFCAVLLPSAVTAAPTGPAWETYGDWQVAAVNDDMDPVSHVVLRTVFKPDPTEVRQGDYYFGFRVFDGSLIIIDVDHALGGKNYWPSCTFDSSSYRIDKGPVGYLATVDGSGSCESVSISIVRRFQAGSVAKLRLNYTTGTVSLKGFSSAWRRSLQLR